MERAFMSPVGPWFRWFAWHPVRTDDRGWRWLRPVWRRRMQSHEYLDGPIVTDWQTVVDRDDIGEPASVADDVPTAVEIRPGERLALTVTRPTNLGLCPRCDSPGCPGRDDILDCTALIDGLSARAHAAHLLRIETCLRCLYCRAPARSTPDGGYCTRCDRHVPVTVVSSP